MRIGYSSPARSARRASSSLSPGAPRTPASTRSGNLGVGSGEALNEHIIGDHWPEAEVRLEMLEEAVEVMRLLWQGGQRSHRGRHWRRRAPDQIVTPVGPDIEAHVESLLQYEEAGVDELFVQQVGPETDGFITTWAREILPRFGS